MRFFQSLASANTAIDIIKGKLSQFPDHGARDGGAVYKISGAEFGCILDALSTANTRAAAAEERATILQQAVLDRCAERDAARARERVLLAERDEAREISSTFASHWPRGSGSRDNALRIALGAVPSPADRALTPENSHAE